MINKKCKTNVIFSINKNDLFITIIKSKKYRGTNKSGVRKYGNRYSIKKHRKTKSDTYCDINKKTVDEIMEIKNNDDAIKRCLLVLKRKYINNDCTVHKIAT